MIRYFFFLLLSRSSYYLIVTCLSIMVWSFLFWGTLHVTKSIQQYFILEGKSIIGGDVVFSAAKPIPTTDTIIQKLRQEWFITHEEFSVSAVIRNPNNDTSTPASLRAVETIFPLYGSVTVSPGTFALEEDGIYAEQVFLDRLGVQVGDSVVLGNTTLRIQWVIIREPDGIASGISFSPRVFVLKNTLTNSGIDIAQSRTSYKLALRSPRPLTQDDRQSLRAFSESNKLRYDDALDGPNRFVQGLDSVQSFIGIVLSIALFLVAVNIIANLTYLLGKFRKTFALLKTFGATEWQIRTIYLCLFGLLGAVNGALGWFLWGWWAQILVREIGARYIYGLQSLSLFEPIIIGFFAGTALIVSASLPFLRSLQHIQPKQLLSNTRITTDTTSYSIYIPILLVLGVILFLISQDIMRTGYSLLILIGVFLMNIFFSYQIIKIVARYRDRYSFFLQSVVASLAWRGKEAVIVIASIMTAFSGVFVISVLEKNIEKNITQNVSLRAPSVYFVDITRTQVPEVRDRAWESFQLYPIVRGRLLTIDGRDMTQSSDPGVTREFNMTYRDNLIAEETLVRGEWHGENIPKSVSIDESFAEEIWGAKIGDVVTVFVQGITVESTITSIRRTNRSSGTPFFFLVFSPDVLSQFPASYFATADIDPQALKQIEKDLSQIAPNIIPIRTDTILSTVTDVLKQLVSVVRIIGIPSIILWLILVMVMTGQSILERRSDVLVLRALGLKKNPIIAIFITEILFIILCAAVVSFVVAHLWAYVLNKFVFSFTLFAIDGVPIVITIFVSIFVTVFAIFMGIRLTHMPLRRLLAEK